eukprot:TRINITY_DN12993_c0_g1_i2.p1 TRINITY_DN12993_c0_g1~~TRINITY_DN12993_c0_g1_i2.p1  ORF type:complete len:285 (-),score=4.59 TRINITY_DN12993_c0_g1_i2:86-940(-)
MSRKLFIFTRWKHENFYFVHFLRQLCLLICELAIENFAVWAVSASDIHKNEEIYGLQDNVVYSFEYIYKAAPWMKNITMYRLGSMPHFLVLMLLLPFSVLWNQVEYSGFGLMSRVVLTIAVCRLIRVPSFLLTILPNPRRFCYRRRFPPVPSSVWQFIYIGFSKVRGGGGCNDLIFSGHGIIWAVVCCMYQTYYPGILSILLWFVYCHISIRTVLERHHYAVDMWLAAVITILVWKYLEFIYPPSQTSKLKKYQIGRQLPSAYVMVLIAIILIAVTVFIIFGGS